MMETLNFDIDINAPANRVWSSLWEDPNYRRWTATFSEGSHAESDWKQGSKIRFVGPNGDGMHGLIETLVPEKTMVFRHMGEIKNGVEQESGWSGAREAYYITEKDGGVKLQVEMDTVSDYKDYFEKTFPDALKVVKEMAEEK